jgi:glycosyltransferase involved in cell wall biosynthesis
LNRAGVVLHVQKVAGISGSEAHLLQLLPDLRARGWDVRFLMLHEDEPGAWEFARELEARDVPLDGIRLRADVDPIAFGEVAAYLARIRPSVLHTHLVHADVYGQLAGTMTRVPLRLSTKHGFNEFREGRFFGLADRSVGSLAHVHIAISQGLAHYLAETEGFDEDDFEIVHYGIASHGDVSALLETGPRLLCVGRLIPIKGHLVLLRALAQARAHVPGVSLAVAGRGPLQPALKTYARELGIEDAVDFLGFVSPVQRAIEEAAIVVVPSLGEGFGMVALEAMERARPVIASAVGGLPEIVVDGETGIVVPPGEAGALADAIVRLAGDLDRCAAMGRQARERALTEFPPERSAARIEELYAAALGPTSEPERRLTRSRISARANAARSASRKSQGAR